MIRIILLFSALLVIASCARDETLAAYGAADRSWALDTLDGQAFGSRATIAFGPSGVVTGTAPCNTFSTTQTAPYPWFALGPIAATRRACPALEAEQRFFDALSSMTISEVSGDLLVLSNDAGREMTFTAE